jgi:nitroreductase
MTSSEKEVEIMDVWQAIDKRRTIRAFKKPVPEKLLMKLILAGASAPSPGNSQPWEFVVVNDPDIIVKIAEVKYQSRKAAKDPEEAAAIHQNSSVVAMCHKKNGLAHVAAWLATENMALAATAEGLGCVTSTFGGEYKEAVQKLIGLPDGYELATVLVLGTPEVRPTKREGGVEREAFSWLHVNKFGNRKQSL